MWEGDDVGEGWGVHQRNDVGVWDDGGDMVTVACGGCVRVVE